MAINKIFIILLAAAIMFFYYFLNLPLPLNLLILPFSTISLTFSNVKSLISVSAGSLILIGFAVFLAPSLILIYLPNALTELAFRQAMGRVVRTASYDDYSRAYVVMPAFKTFEKFAKRVEEEMSPANRIDPGPPKEKVCPQCGESHPLVALECLCGYEFPRRPEGKQVKKCLSCGGK
jgi:hypothetical protein